MNSDAQAENVEAIALGLEPPHCEVWVCDLDDGVLWLTLHTDAQRMSALRAERALQRFTERLRDATTGEILDLLETTLRGDRVR